MLNFPKTLLAGLFLSVSVTAAGSQVQTAPAETFTSENAILDTSILFAIGAREARQELRGAFGWPTFEEGLVDGVYFRFDPDGYARFSPNPRLDTDVFEVICRPRTYSCMGRKGSLSYMLNSRGELQLRLENAAEGDRFFVVEGISELEVPSRILQPLDDRMETLLSSSDELIIRRGQEEIGRISLVGFGAVSAYLRWISAKQDYTVLPRGWPIPNGANGLADTNLTQVANWQSPMPQPQAPIQVGVSGGTEIAEVRGELNILRELLLEREENTVSAAPVQQQPTTPVASETQRNEAVRIAELERSTAALQAELDLLKSSSPTSNEIDPLVRSGAVDQVGSKSISVAAGIGTETLLPQAVVPAAAPQNEAASLAQRLEYLMSEIGLDAKTALMIIEMGSDTPNDTTQEMTVETLAETYQDQIVSDILAELQNAAPNPTMAQSEPISSTVDQPVVAPMSPQDYVLLTDYFRSVFETEQLAQ